MNQAQAKKTVTGDRILVDGRDQQPVARHELKGRGQEAKEGGRRRREAKEGGRWEVSGWVWVRGCADGGEKVGGRTREREREREREEDGCVGE